MSGFDLKQVSRNDKGLIGAGIVVFISSFFDFYGSSFGSWTAWHSYGFLGVLLLLLATVVAAARVLANAKLPKLPVGENLLVAGLAALGTLLLILRGVTYKTFPGVGLQWGAYVIFIAGAAVTAFAVMNFRSSGEKLAWDATALNKPGTAGGAPVPPVPPAQATSQTDQPTASSSDQV
jgi:hypothetical protein